MKQEKITIAIDPGNSGSWAVRYPDDSTVVYKYDSEANVSDEMKALAAHYSEIDAVLEKVHAMPGQGVTSMFTFGANYGFWRGTLLALRISFREVPPQTWQKGMIAGKLGGPARKRALLQVAKERYPKLKPTLATADSLLILDWYLNGGAK